MSSFLVTGGAGFIGSHLTEKLISLGHSVRVLDNLRTGRIENLDNVKGRFELTVADAADPSKAKEVMLGIEGVFHLAAMASADLSVKEPLQNQHSGELSTLVILDSARRAGVRRVVYSSSAAVYGDAGNKVNMENATPAPLSFYGLSKWVGEEYCRMLSSLYPEFDTACLRYFNVFGTRQDPSSPYSGVITIFLRCLAEGRRPIIFGDGKQTRDFVHVSDVVEANIAAMNSKLQLRGDGFNVGSGASISIIELWNYLAKIAGSDLYPEFGDARSGDILYSRADIAKIKDMFHFRIGVSWQEGLAKLWESSAADSKTRIRQP